MDKKNITAGRRRYDIILIASLLILSVAVLAVVLLWRNEGGVVEVQLGGETVAVYELDKNGEYDIGDGSNRLCIENGEVYMSHADCPDKVCVKTGRIKYTGQSIICLPNKVTLTVRDAGGGVDLVS